MKIFLKNYENKKIVFKTTESLFLKLIKNILRVYKNGKQLLKIFRVLKTKLKIF